MEDEHAIEVILHIQDVWTLPLGRRRLSASPFKRQVDWTKNKEKTNSISVYSKVVYYNVRD